MRISFNAVGVAYRSGSRERCLFNDLTAHFELAPGEVLGLMGESGSGKSSLLRLIAGVAKPSDGTVSVDGMEPGDVAFLPQGGVLLEHLSLDQNLRLFSRLRATRFRYDEERLRSAIKVLDLDGLVDARLPLEKLSGGERQRVCLARILSITPRLVLLDEPCSGLGGDHRTEFLASLKRSAVELGYSAILASHEWNDHVLVANQVAFLKQGGAQGLSDVPLTSVSEFSRSPWHQEAVSYTTASPINWIDAERRDNGSWSLTLDGCVLAEARLEPSPAQDRIVVACSPANFLGSRSAEAPTGFTHAGTSDSFAFVGLGDKVLVLPRDFTGAGLSLEGSALVFSAEDGTAIGRVMLL